jgi:class 3 adenylate cyclase
MELLADRDPEEARKLLDPVLERMMEAVHRYEGTVNQVMGDGIMRSSARRSLTRTTPCGRATPRSICRGRCGG